DTIKRTDGAETLFDAVQSDDSFSLAVHRPEDSPLSPRGTRIVYFFAASTTFWASSAEYSTLATPPFSVLARFCSRLPWSMRRNGTTRSFGTSLPSRIICATQKASVETPG